MKVVRLGGCEMLPWFGVDSENMLVLLHGSLCEV